MKLARAKRTEGNDRLPTRAAEHTISELLEYLSPGSSKTKVSPSWPPDAFALTGLILLRVGAYRHALMQWPPFQHWEKSVNAIAKAWRKAWNLEEPPPKAVSGLWRTILEYKETRLDSVCDQRGLCISLMQLHAVADACCYAIGLPTPSSYRRNERLWFLNLTSRKLRNLLPMAAAMEKLPEFPY